MRKETEEKERVKELLINVKVTIIHESPKKVKHLFGKKTTGSGWERKPETKKKITDVPEFDRLVKGLNKLRRLR